MKTCIMALAAIGMLLFLSCGRKQQKSGELQVYAGSSSCRECHEDFYQLWSSSFHGLAMQPYSRVFAETHLISQQKDIVINPYSYRAEMAGENGYVIETGPGKQKKYKIDHVMGGKNVFYFLTRMDRGRLQTLPVAYDVKKKEWFDTAASGVRHFPGQDGDAPISWKEWPYTFNTSCYGCHVSQLSTNYDSEKDIYSTQWAEPGINCETCHGPGAEHNNIARNTTKGEPLPELKIISTKTMTREQRNSLCASCHAKTFTPLTNSYSPKGRFFDFYDLITLENPDYYPDGRDLGENYTYTSWLMSPCVKSGELDCMHCHTSSGRYRFKNDQVNNACLPCHGERVTHVAEHTHHRADSSGSRCISCHMPMTSFARMNRSDHSMLPPTPTTSILFQSPNACNICHTDRDAAWADEKVREWHKKDYQAKIVHRAQLVVAARNRDWTRLDEMLKYIFAKDRDDIFAASLIRMINVTRNDKIEPTLLLAASDPSPLVRSAAIGVLEQIKNQKSIQAIIDATLDDYRLVRIRAASILAAYPELLDNPEYREQISRAQGEYLTSLLSRPDFGASHYNLGNFYLQRREYTKAITAYETAIRFEPTALLATVNSSIAYARIGDIKKAEQSLLNALHVAPQSAAANFNMGLLRAEQGNMEEAEKYLREALKADSLMAPAAYNLGVILAKEKIEEAILFLRRAHDIQTDDPKYSYSLAFYLRQSGKQNEARKLLLELIENYPENREIQLLLENMTKGQ